MIARARPQLFRNWQPLKRAAQIRTYAVRTEAGGNLIYEEKGGARIYTLNRPKALNAITGEMFHSLNDTIKVSCRT